MNHLLHQVATLANPWNWLSALFFRGQNPHELTVTTTAPGRAVGSVGAYALAVGQAVRLGDGAEGLGLIVADAATTPQLGCDALILTLSGELVRWSGAIAPHAAVPLRTLGPSGLRYRYSSMAVVGLDMFDGLFDAAFRQARRLAR